MKVNRFGMSQKIFCDMFVHWFKTQCGIAQAQRFNGARDEALKTLLDAEIIAAKTLREDEPWEMQAPRRMLARLREEITLELSAPEEASALSS